jgi:hypothetical protein
VVTLWVDHCFAILSGSRVRSADTFSNKIVRENSGDTLPFLRGFAAKLPNGGAAKFH